MPSTNIPIAIKNAETNLGALLEVLVTLSKVNMDTKKLRTRHSKLVSDLLTYHAHLFSILQRVIAYQTSHPSGGTENKNAIYVADVISNMASAVLLLANAVNGMIQNKRKGPIEDAITQVQTTLKQYTHRKTSLLDPRDLANITSNKGIIILELKTIFTSVKSLTAALPENDALADIPLGDFSSSSSSSSKIRSIDEDANDDEDDFVRPFDPIPLDSSLKPDDVSAAAKTAAPAALRALLHTINTVLTLPKMARPNGQFKEYKQLCDTLKQLHSDLNVKLNKSHVSLEKIKDIQAVAEKANTMLQELVDPSKNTDNLAGKKIVNTFVNDVKQLKSFQDSAWVKTAKIIACIAIVATCCVVGAAIGAFTFGLIAAIVTAPPTAGAGAIFAAIPAAIAGAVAGGGLACGLAISAIGGASLAGFGLGLFGASLINKTRLTQAAKYGYTAAKKRPNLT